ncbi:uncharacterized protein LAESUDRAFT_726914 [Laetiporus sulphureus 93-53]|uniref:Uncharacterized protein n=1 Tax=Laetiporus sulphureus 93-53 TaxID=1314785 RepID=A0A165DTT9_9APHY|nr:uncharacterized protein LAESUDRAFT_726914 [Laetiporus sulphureus 93-53]KZT05623.1 hypothetical protein LAESUDRAFT_726914 [Laetiporus sulphureus 93-53]
MCLRYASAPTTIRSGYVDFHSLVSHQSSLLFITCIQCSCINIALVIVQIHAYLLQELRLP